MRAEGSDRAATAHEPGQDRSLSPTTEPADRPQADPSGRQHRIAYHPSFVRQQLSPTGSPVAIGRPASAARLARKTRASRLPEPKPASRQRPPAMEILGSILP